MSTEQLKKVYVKSGDLEWVGMATGPLDAVKKALKGIVGKTLDGYNFYVDERGYRIKDSEFTVPVEEGLAYAGFVFDDPDCVDDC